jgi:hypothetical protein
MPSNKNPTTGSPFLKNTLFPKPFMFRFLLFLKFENGEEKSLRQVPGRVDNRKS